MAAEEFGIVLCLVVVALFAFIVMRALTRALRDEDPFTRFAAAGLAILFGMQSAINMAVNLHLIPAKGMTLPFISYGGSSLISLAYGMGMLLALTRERPRAEIAAGAAATHGLIGRRVTACMRTAQGESHAAHSGRRRRYRRASVSGRGAGAGADAARHRRSRSRPTIAPRNARDISSSCDPCRARARPCAVAQSDFDRCVPASMLAYGLFKAATLMLPG